MADPSWFESGDSVVADTARWTDSAQIVSIAKLWIYWARSAKTRSAEATAARAAMVIEHQGGDSAEVSRLLDVETGAALVTVCSAVFAVESISIALRNRVVDQATMDGWTRTKLGADRRLAQILQRGIAARATADDLSGRWAALYRLRGMSVHFEEVGADLADHPVGTKTDPIHVTFSAETAAAAVATLVDTLQALLNDPHPRAHFWGAEHRGAVAEFI
jgi:hypothetical protein